MDILKDKDVKIRKPQKCFGCAREFSVGVKLRYLVQVDQGDFVSSYWCPTCQKYWKEYMRYDDSVAFGDLRDNDRETWEKFRVSVEGK